MEATCFTHWKGDRPYVVRFNIRGLVRIFAANVEEYDESKHAALDPHIYPRVEFDGHTYINAPSNVPIMVIPSAYRVWVGKSAETPMTLYSGAYGSRFDGNTVLIQPMCGINEYIHVCNRVYRFKTSAPIVQYESPVGNNDCPYPYAYDVNLTAYLLIESVALTKCKTHPTFSTDAALFCPYNYYYGFNHDENTPTPYPGRILPGVIFVDEEDLDWATGKYEGYYNVMSCTRTATLDRRVYYRCITEEEEENEDGLITPSVQLSETSVDDLIATFNAEHGYTHMDIVSSIHHQKVY